MAYNPAQPCQPVLHITLMVLLIVALTAMMHYILFASLRPHKETLVTNAKLYPSYAFLLSGFKNEYLLWDYWVTLRKTALLVIPVIAPPSVSFGLRSIGSTAVVMIALVWHLLYLPYIHEDINNLETVALSAATATLMCSQYVYTDSGWAWEGSLATGIALVINVGFLLFTLTYAVPGLRDIWDTWMHVDSGESALAQEVQQDIDTGSTRKPRGKESVLASKSENNGESPNRKQTATLVIAL